MVKPIVEQNANTGVFSLGDFQRDPAQRGKHDMRGDGSFKCAQIDMVSRKRFTVVKLGEIRIIFPETDTVFRETDIVEVPGRGNGGWNEAGLICFIRSPLDIVSLPTPFGGRSAASSGPRWARAVY